MQTIDTDIWRGGPGGLALRAADAAAAGLGVVDIEFARFDQFNEIDSYWEGRFLERYTPGSFAETIVERGDHIKVLYDHGHDPSIGNKVLGPHRNLRETPTGPAAELELLDTSYNRDLAAGIAAGLYGASFRFRVTAESWDDEPEESDHNPAGIPERTIERVELYEFGPVTFPADESTHVGMRSLTDRYRSQAIPAADPVEGSGPDSEPDLDETPDGASKSPKPIRHDLRAQIATTLTKGQS